MPCVLTNSLFRRGGRTNDTRNLVERLRSFREITEAHPKAFQDVLISGGNLPPLASTVAAPGAAALAAGVAIVAEEVCGAPLVAGLTPPVPLDGVAASACEPKIAPIIFPP
jgi:hypothetical protein